MDTIELHPTAALQADHFQFTRGLTVMTLPKIWSLSATETHVILQSDRQTGVGDRIVLTVGETQVDATVPANAADLVTALHAHVQGDYA